MICVMFASRAFLSSLAVVALWASTSTVLASAEGLQFESKTTPDMGSGNSDSPSALPSESAHAQFLRSGEAAAVYGDWKSAQGNFQKAIELEDSDYISFYDLGIAQYHLGLFKDSVQSEQKAIELNPKFMPAYIQLASVQTRTGAVDLAEKTLRSALQENPDSDEIKKSISALPKLNGSVKAEVKVDPLKEVPAQLKYATELFNAGEVTKSVDILKQIVVSDPSNVLAHSNLAMAYGIAGDYTSSIAECRKSLKLQPNNVNMYLNGGWAAAKRKDWNASLSAYEAAFKLDRRSAEALIGAAVAKAKMGRLEEAKSVLRTETAANPNLALPRMGMAIVLEEEGLPQLAVLELAEAKRVEPNNVKVQHNLAVAAFQLACSTDEHDHWEQAAQEYGDLLKSAPYDAEAYLGLGITLDKLHRPSEAMAMLQKAVANAPKSAAAHAAYGLCLARQARRDEALVETRKALKLDPNLDMARNLLAKLAH